MNTQIHSEGYDIFETARNIEAWIGMGYGNSHQLRGSTLLTATKQTTRATVDFHSDSSAAVAAFFKANTDVQEPIFGLFQSLCH